MFTEVSAPVHSCPAVSTSERGLGDGASDASSTRGGGPRGVPELEEEGACACGL